MEKFDDSHLIGAAPLTVRQVLDEIGVSKISELNGHIMPENLTYYDYGRFLTYNFILTRRMFDKDTGIIKIHPKKYKTHVRKYTRGFMCEHRFAKDYGFEINRVLSPVGDGGYDFKTCAGTTIDIKGTLGNIIDVNISGRYADLFVFYIRADLRTEESQFMGFMKKEDLVKIPAKFENTFNGDNRNVQVHRITQYSNGLIKDESKLLHLLNGELNRGERNNNSILTEDYIKIIRSLYNLDFKIKDIKDVLKLLHEIDKNSPIPGNSTLSDIVRGVTWTHI